MAVDNVKSLIDAEMNGQTFFSSWRKQPTQTTGANIWFDLSMSPGNPRPNNYIGNANTFTRLAQSTDGGIPHGGTVAPQQKFLRLLSAQTSSGTAVPLPMMVLDYLGFYPFIDESDTTEQAMDNTVGLSRYADGEGVQIMPIVVAPQSGGTAGFVVTYTNSKGVTGRKTPRHIIGTQAVNGTIITSAGAVVDSCGPFMALERGDTGAPIIESIKFDGVGDIGLMTLVLVKPIAKHSIRGIDAPVEQDFFMDSSSLPEIKDDAYLNFISLPVGTLAAAPIYGWIKTLWV